MKHLKTYEHTTEDAPTITKKYILVENKNNIRPFNVNLAYILEIIHISNTLIDYKQLYYLDTEGYLSKNIHKPNNMTIEMLFKFNILTYQSDELQDCINIMKILINSNKYNL